MFQRQRFDGWRCYGPGVAFNVSDLKIIEKIAMYKDEEDFC